MATHSSTLTLETPMDGGAWCAAVHGVSKSWTWLSTFTFTFYFHALEKEIATHSSILAWRIQGWGSLVGCCLWGRKVGHDWSDLAAAAAPWKHASMLKILQARLSAVHEPWTLVHAGFWRGRGSRDQIAKSGSTIEQARELQKSIYFWKDWCWSQSSNTLATWCEELTPWKRPWCWERLKAEGEGNNRGWDGGMASPTQWTWVWASSWSW